MKNPLIVGKASLSLALTLCVTTFSILSADAAQPKPPAGFQALFNGTDLTGFFGLEHFDPRKWQSMSEAERAAKKESNKASFTQHWRVENAELVNDGQGPYATTEKEYGDFELLLEYKTVPKADSGIYLRGNPQVQIWDFTEKEKFKLGSDKGSGGLWNNSAGAPGKDPTVLADKPFGQWNSFRVQMVGERVTVHLNGKLVVDHARMENFWDRSKPLWARGFLQLQTHGGEIRWRNIFIREISSKEATEILHKHGNKGFKKVFNGKNFDGWKGPVDNYTAENGVITCKPHQGGTIYYGEELTDFAARLEFKVPAGGNNGLAIRYPGTGDTAYVGMCELQVLDDTAAQYAKLDPRQYHGSAYGMTASHRGFQRPVGEWNYQEVIVQGSKITVELNGTQILNTDLSTVKDFMANSAHPGKDRTSGYFGFAGHSDPVSFRNIEIKSLKK